MRSQRRTRSGSTGCLSPLASQAGARGTSHRPRRGGLPLGRHRIVVNELLDTRGGVLEEQMVIPFVVAELPELPDGMRVEHATQVRVDELQLTRLPVERRGERVARFVKAVKSQVRRAPPNGTRVTAAKATNSGTSFAAPAAAGVAALVQDVNATLQSWPEGCRAILLAGADRKRTGPHVVEWGHI
jgi:subtilisin family serine protease